MRESKSGLETKDAKEAGKRYTAEGHGSVVEKCQDGEACTWICQAEESGVRHARSHFSWRSAPPCRPKAKVVICYSER